MISGVICNSKVGEAVKLRQAGDYEIISFRVATYEGKDKQGNYLSSYHTVDKWQPLDWHKEAIQPGSFVEVQGRIRYDQYTDQTGNKVTRTIIVADRIDFPRLPAAEVAPQPVATSQPAPAPAQPTAQPQQTLQQPTGPAADPFNTGLPF